MKSKALSKAVREEILDNIMENWTTNNPAPFNINEERQKTGDAIWKLFYGHLDYGNVPEDMFFRDTVVKYSVNGVCRFRALTESKPVLRQSTYSQAVFDDFDKEPKPYRDFEKLEKVYDKWLKEADDFKENITQILSSASSTKQLILLWPESEQFFPASLKVLPAATTLPALVTKNLNKALGITKG